MKGVSEVIAIILILMITISLAGLAYMFMSTTMSDVTSSAGSNVNTATSSMITSFVIDSMDAAKIYIRNTGQSALDNLSVYIGGEPATFNITPSSIEAGSVGTITIYSFIPDGATVKVTSPSGFSTSNIANICDKAIGCWKFDEGSGNVAYDSSNKGNSGSILNGTVWTSGYHGNGLLFDGSGSYVWLGNPSSLSPNNIALDAMFKKMPSTGVNVIVRNRLYGWGLLYRNSTLEFDVFESNTRGLGLTIAGYDDGTWHRATGTYDGTTAKLFVDGTLVNYTVGNGTGVIYYSGMYVAIGRDADWGGAYFNGTIDEVRIYDRAIY
jgi:flagellin-like protein